MEIDREVIVRAQAGDRAACEAIVEQFGAMVFRLISRFFRTREDVEDLAQDVFLKVFTRIDQDRPEENFPGWLGGGRINRCYAHLRKTRRRSPAYEIYGPQQEAESVAPEVAPELDGFGAAR